MFVPLVSPALAKLHTPTALLALVLLGILLVVTTTHVLFNVSYRNPKVWFKLKAELIALFSAELNLVFQTGHTRLSRALFVISLLKTILPNPLSVTPVLLPFVSFA